MNLSTQYLGLSLPHPLMVGASPIVDDLDLVQRVAEAGAAAIVMHSLFEEQWVAEQLAHAQHVYSHADSFAEANSFLPPAPSVPIDYALGPDAYLEQIRRIKERVGLPVIGSLNGYSGEGWAEYARLIEEAGADALELNMYHVPTNIGVAAGDIEQHQLEIVRSVATQLGIPVTVKLAPLYSSLPHFAQGLKAAGARGVVLFNRFYEPDIDVAQLELAPTLHLSTSQELPLRLRFLAVLSGRLNLSLGASGGIHSGRDALKAVLAGAHGVQMVSALLQHGPEHMAVVLKELQELLTQLEYESLAQAQGSMSLLRCPDPTHYERGNYLRILHTWPRT